MGRKKSAESAEAQEGKKAESQKQAEKYPYLKTPAEVGGVLLEPEERESSRALTEADLAAAREEQFKTAQSLRETQLRQKELAKQEHEQEQALKSTREQGRKAEQEALRLGDELATYAEEVHSGIRKITIECAVTLTRGNEIVVTDGRDGKELERRTATADELEEASQTQTGLIGSSDSPDKKEKPETRMVQVSLKVGAYQKAKRSIKRGLEEPSIPDVNDEDATFAIFWKVDEDKVRTRAEVPAWIASRLALVASGDKSLDFRIEELKQGGAAPAASAVPKAPSNVVQVEFGQAPQQ